MNFVADLDSELLRRWLAGDDSVLAELVEGFWDRQYLRKYALPQIPPPRVPVGPPPVRSAEAEVLADGILANVLGWLANDPDPEPNRQLRHPARNLIPRLSDKTMRLKSAKKLLDQMNQATKALEAEISNLKR